MVATSGSKLSEDCQRSPFATSKFNRNNDDLVLASFGRGFYILDDYSPLRHVDQEDLLKTDAIMPIQKGHMIYATCVHRWVSAVDAVSRVPIFTPLLTPYGVSRFTYHLKDSLENEKVRTKIQGQKGGGSRQRCTKYPSPGKISRLKTGRSRLQRTTGHTRQLRATLCRRIQRKHFKGTPSDQLEPATRRHGSDVVDRWRYREPIPSKFRKNCRWRDDPAGRADRVRNRTT
jgi:hypothetical protein